MDAAPVLEDAEPVLEEVVDAASDLEPGLRLRGMFGIGERHFVFKLMQSQPIMENAHCFNRTTIVQCHISSVRCLSLAAMEVCGYPKGKPYCRNAALMVITID